MNYLVSDTVVRMKNAAHARRKEVVLPYSKLIKNIGGVLVKEGYLSEISEKTDDGKKSLVAVLAYDKRTPVLTGVKILSRPSLRTYAGKNERDAMFGRGLGIIIVSTNKGVMTGRQAEKMGVGGELLFKIW